ncbi:MAG TPA: hypothetical protein VGK99_19495 [Acidobacteriota bacterium]
MKYRVLQWLSLFIVAAGVLFFLTFESKATLKYTKETEKNCAFCHTGIPRKGDENPQLTEDGKRFKENGYKLTDAQKEKPNPQRD